MRQNNTGLIILAAGASTRLGTPKQLVEFKGETLLHRIVREAVSSVCHPIVVVLGAETNKSRQVLSEIDIHIVENPDWAEGMGSSVRIGLNKLLEIEAAVDGVVLTVCDQPFVTSETINKLVEAFQERGAPVVASAYHETLGVPALFSRELFPLLADLKEGGAKKIIRQFESETVKIPFPAGAIDIDTPEDFQRLQSE